MLTILNDSTFSITATLSGTPTTPPRFSVIWKGTGGPANPVGVLNTSTAAKTLLSGVNGQPRQVEQIQIYNADDASVTVTIALVINGTSYPMVQAVLAVGYTLFWNTKIGATIVNNTGAASGGSSYTFESSITETDDVVTLVNDEAEPEAFNYYGTDSMEAVGYHELPIYSANDSIQVVAGQVNLVGDTAAPGNSKVYGTDGAGARGWYDAPAAALTPWTEDVDADGNDLLNVATIKSEDTDGTTSASLTIETGTTSGGFNAGNLIIKGGGATGGASAADVEITGGACASGSSGDVIIKGGPGTSGASGGNITLDGGTTSGGDIGSVIINGASTWLFRTYLGTHIGWFGAVAAQQTIASNVFSGLTFSDPPTQAECQFLRDACDSLLAKIVAYGLIATTA